MSLPAWAEELRLRYLAGESSLFLLHGAVRDLHPSTADDGTVEFVPLRVFLERFLGRTKDLVAYHNVSEGLGFPSRAAEDRARMAVNAARVAQGEPEWGDMPRGSGDVLRFVEDLVTLPNHDTAVILDYVEMVAPQGELGFMGEADKANLVTLQRWASDPALLGGNSLVVMVTERLTDVHRRVVANAQLAAVHVPLPDVGARAAFLASIARADVKVELEDEALAKVTAGLNLVQIRGLFRRAAQTGGAIGFRTVSRRKKAIIEQECHGLVEFVDPDHDFSHVGGMARIKADLMRIARFVREGKVNRVPMGVMLVGPMGTGKTFLAEAFAAECGLTCLKFKNFRDRWVGSTEGNLDKILEVVEALGHVLLIVDEADRSLSSGTDGDGGTSGRVIARLKEFMSDTSHRGRVVVMMMTNRPDKMDADLKRPGRLDLKIPFFFPETVEERRLILAAQVRKQALVLGSDVDLLTVAGLLDGRSSAELEAVLLAAASRAAEGDRDALVQADLVGAAEDVIPSRDTRMLAFMEMLAVFESSSQSLLPARYRGLHPDEVHARLDELRVNLGARSA
jgi:ATP-dependent 26S proteasome regulatory subunit